jgi:hypothetical protein
MKSSLAALRKPALRVQRGARLPSATIIDPLPPPHTRNLCLFVCIFIRVGNKFHFQNMYIYADNGRERGCDGENEERLRRFLMRLSSFEKMRSNLRAVAN